MKKKKLMGFVVLFASLNAFADSIYLDREPMRDCGGTVTLRESDNGDLALKFEGLRTDRCNNLRFYDVSSGATLKVYSIQGTSYTLSKEQRESLNSDCRLGFTVSGSFRTDKFHVVLNRCRVQRPQPLPLPSRNNQSFQLSNKGNCKLLINGTFSNRIVDDKYCTGARGDDVVSYEFSNNNNCKRMINGQYSNVNVADSYCTARL